MDNTQDALRVALEIGSSDPRDDLSRLDSVARHRPAGLGEKSFQQFTGTNVAQWHVRTFVSWHPVGPLFMIADKPVSAAPASEQPAPNQGMAFPALSWQQLAKDARARIMIEQGTGHEMLCFNVGAFQQIVDQLSKRAPASNQPMTDEQIIDAVDRPGFAWDNLNSAEQRNLLGTIRALLAQQAADSSAERKAAERYEKLKCMPKQWLLDAIQNTSVSTRYGGMGLDDAIDAVIAAQSKPEGGREMSEHELLGLKRKRDVLMREAELAAYEYFCACEIGPEREKAHEIYENIRNAGRVY